MRSASVVESQQFSTPHTTKTTSTNHPSLPQTDNYNYNDKSNNNTDYNDKDNNTITRRTTTVLVNPVT